MQLHMYLHYVSIIAYFTQCYFHSKNILKVVTNLRVAMCQVKKELAVKRHLINANTETFSR